MNQFLNEHDGAEVLYLSRRDVIRCCSEVDVVGVVADALGVHTKGQIVLPEEAYMGWENSDGFTTRSLAMQGGIRYDDREIYGVKVINGSLGNVAKGLPRSQGFSMTFDPETARPQVIMEAAFISSLRTAAVTVAAAQAVGRSTIRSAAIVGCGTLAKAHMGLLKEHFPELEHLRSYDIEPDRSAQFAKEFGGTSTATAQAAIEGADLVILTTIVTESYLPYEWLSPGALVAHVSLDDVMPDVVEKCDLLLVDDWSLVRDDERRLLGRMYRSGDLLDPAGNAMGGVSAAATARRVDGTIGEAILGVVNGRTSDDDIVLSNPFGMSILDVAVADRVLQVAQRLNLGVRLEV